VSLTFLKGSLSVSTTRLLKAILPGACIWTGLRDVEGFGYEKTIQELNELYPTDDSDAMMDDDTSMGENIPESIREMADSKSAIEALGSMVWYVGVGDENIIVFISFSATGTFANLTSTKKY
jgi:DNA mismatch repair protein MSH6